MSSSALLRCPANDNSLLEFSSGRTSSTLQQSPMFRSAQENVSSLLSKITLPVYRPILSIFEFGRSILSKVSSQEIEQASFGSWDRDVGPSSYLLKIQSFSSLTRMISGCGNEFYQSKIFEVNGYKWSLLIYPNGDKFSKGYISMFLQIEDTYALPLAWVIHADVKFFIFDQIRAKFTIFQEYKVSRFHKMKSKCGIGKMVTRRVFDDAANGFLVNDKSVFGVEVFLLPGYKFAAVECVVPDMKLDEVFTWKVLDYNNLGSEVCCSNEFEAFSFRWKLILYPSGDSQSLKTHLSLYLELVSPQIHCIGLFVRLILRLRNQKFGVWKDKEIPICAHIAPGNSVCGCSKCFLLADVQDLSKGFLDNNSIIIEAQINNVSPITSSIISTKDTCQPLHK